MSRDKAGIATHYLRYSSSSVMVLLAGLVSFPILTRLLDNTQYGILGYYETWVLMAVAVGKLGAQHAMLRFYPHGQGETQVRAFSTNLFYLPLAITLSLWLVAVSTMAVFDLASGSQQSPVFWLVVVAVPLSVFTSQVDTVLRITENSKWVMVSRIGWRWLELMLMVGAVVLIQRSAVAVYGGKLAAAIVMVCFYVYWVRRNLFFSWSAIDTRPLRQGLVYGMPLAMNEIIAVALITLDRLMLKGMTGDFAAVGIYTIGFSLAMQVSVFTNLTVFEAFTPMANRLYVTEGSAAVRNLKARILMPMTYAAIGVAALLWCFGTDVIVALSGVGKAASGRVFTIVGMTYALQPLLLIGGYGLLLERRSTKVFALMCATLAINAVLNLLWIPAYGVMGAVYATAVSSMALAVAHCLWVPKALRQLPDLRSATTALVAALVSVATGAGASGVLQLAAGWPRLLVGGAIVAGLYALVSLMADERLRALLRHWRNRAVLAATASKS